MLLFNYLQEFIFYKDAKMLLLLPQELRIRQGYTGCSTKTFALEGQLFGEEIDSSRHEMLVDVKAVTLHRFELLQKGGKWQAVVVLDI